MEVFPLISVIVPIYNTANYLEKCVDSLLAQTYERLEIVLVDDGSTDESLEICYRYEKKYSQIKCVHIENHGVSYARNIGLAVATGEYIGFVDSDDWIEPNMYRILYTSMVSNDAQLVSCTFFNDLSNNKQYKYSKSHINTTDFEEQIILGSSMYGEVLNHKEIGGYLCNKLFCKEFIKKNFETALAQCEDFLFVVQYLQGINTMVHISERLYHYYQPTYMKNSLVCSARLKTLIPAYEQILSLYRVEAPEYAIDMQKETLKMYLNFRARYKLTHLNEPQFWMKICSGIHTHWRDVLNSKSTTFFEKINIVLTYMFPCIVLQLKHTLQLKLKQ